MKKAIIFSLIALFLFAFTVSFLNSFLGFKEKSVSIVEPIEELSETIKIDQLSEGKLMFNYFENNDFKLTIDKVTDNYKEKYMDIKEGMKAVRIDYTVINKSDNNITIYDFNAKYNNTTLDNEYLSDSNLHIEYDELLSKTKKSGAVCFLVEKEAKNVTLVYEYDWLYGDMIEFKLQLSEVIQ